MRKFILIAGLVLASAAAQATDRSLSAVGSDALTAAVPAKVAETQKTAEAPQVAATQVTEAPKAEAPKYVDRPALVEPKTETPKAAQSNTEPDKPVAQTAALTPKAEKPRRTRYWTEGRIISELHRHGIYW
jgi:hypothetical protein